MAEIAGLVIGGIPLVLKALEYYHEPVRDYWRYDSTLGTIRSNIFIQQEQLDVTLSKLGLDRLTPSQLEQHLKQQFPGKYSEYMTIFGRMGMIVKNMMDKLDIDIQGKVSELQVT